VLAEFLLSFPYPIISYLALFSIISNVNGANLNYVCQNIILYDRVHEQGKFEFHHGFMQKNSRFCICHGR
jgi:hypothetical protein